MISGLSYGVSIEAPYLSKSWKRLLHYDDEFKAYHSKWFYLDGRSLKREWELSIDAIKNKRLVGREKELFQCAFPARFKFIKKFHEDLKDVHCKKFISFKKEINAKELYLVYASSYLTNPASMFGHTFLRLSKGGKKRKDVLDDYTVGFLARTNTQDNSLLYAYKGITGSYIGHYEIKPFYQNVGLNQNSEARDLWHYKVNLSQKQIDFFIAHLFELSTNTGFRYYFFDENCSSVLLRTLQVVEEQMNPLDRIFIFAHPLETIKWMSKYIDHSETSYYPSINRLLEFHLNKMSDEQRNQFYSVNNEYEHIEKVNSPLVLDTLIDYWKFKNYKKENSLSEKDKKKMNTILRKRASLKKRSTYKSKVSRANNPIEFHDPNQFEIGYKDNKQFSGDYYSFKLGYQAIDDIPLGHDQFSFIDYFGFRLIRLNNKLKLQNLNLISITSLSSYLKELKKYSWSLGVKWDRENVFLKDEHLLIDAEVGISKFYKSASFSFLAGARSFLSSSFSRIAPKVSLISRIPVFDEHIFVLKSDTYYFDESFLCSIKALVNISLMKNLSVYFSFNNERGLLSSAGIEGALRWRL